MKYFAITAAAVVALGLGATWYLGRAPDVASCTESKVVGGDIGGSFELVTSSGQTVTDKDVITEPSLIYFGYTYCPDVCPFDVARNADAVDILTEQGYSVTPVFITIDPARDTPEIIADYAENMHDKMIGLTGSDDQIAAASSAYKTYYKAQYNGTDEYLVDHSTFTYLVMPETGFVDFFRRDVTPEKMAERTACFIDAS